MEGEEKKLHFYDSLILSYISINIVRSSNVNRIKNFCLAKFWELLKSKCKTQKLHSP